MEDMTESMEARDRAPSWHKGHTHCHPWFRRTEAFHTEAAIYGAKFSERVGHLAEGSSVTKGVPEAKHCESLTEWFAARAIVNTGLPC